MDADELTLKVSMPIEAEAAVEHEEEIEVNFSSKKEIQ